MSAATPAITTSSGTPSPKSPMLVGARRAAAPPSFPAPVASAPQPQPCELRIELRRGTIVATVNWPISASAECAGWLRELLR